MAWIKDEIGRAVGLPPEIGGIPLDTIGATGFGLSVSIEAASKLCGLDLQGARIVVQGFGSVGKHAARFLAAKGAILVGAADSQGTISHPKGIDIVQLTALKDAGKSVLDYQGGEKLHRDAAIDIQCEVWIPAARPDVLRADNVQRLKAKMVASGANIPATAEAEQELHRRGIIVLPDFIANAGGVICAAVEYHGGSQAAAFPTIEEKIHTNTTLVIEEAVKTKVPPRQAAVALAERRVRNAMSYRRWGA